MEAATAGSAQQSITRLNLGSEIMFFKILNIYSKIFYFEL